MNERVPARIFSIKPAPPHFESIRLQEISSAIERRGKAIRYHGRLECSREMEDTGERLYIDHAGISRFRVRLSIWADGVSGLASLNRVLAAPVAGRIVTPATETSPASTHVRFLIDSSRPSILPPKLTTFGPYPPTKPPSFDFSARPGGPKEISRWWSAAEPPDAFPKVQTAPAGAGERCGSIAPAGALHDFAGLSRGFRSFLAAPPANFCRPSGP